MTTNCRSGLSLLACSASVRVICFPSRAIADCWVDEAFVHTCIGQLTHAMTLQAALYLQHGTIPARFMWSPHLGGGKILEQNSADVT